MEITRTIAWEITEERDPDRVVVADVPILLSEERNTLRELDLAPIRLERCYKHGYDPSISIMRHIVT
jgi:hypothetical protein